MSEQPNLATVIQQAKANFYASNGSANSVFEQIINMLVGEIQNRERMIADLQKILEESAPKKKQKKLEEETIMTEKEFAENIKANN